MSGVLIFLFGVPFAVLLGARILRQRSRTRALRDRERRLREENVLAAVRSLLDASRVSSMAVIQALDKAIRALDPRVDSFLVLLTDGEELACVYASGERARHYERVRIRRDAVAFLPARAAISGHRAGGSEGTMIPTDRCGLAVPMLDGTGLRGVVYVSSSCSGALASEETIVRTIEHATSPYALAVEREADRADATYDGLTGLFTPRAFRARLAEEVDRARRGKPNVMTLWFIDTDRFKTVNDEHGHAAGDSVLQTMAELMRAHTVPEVDIVGRNGGDEFCALLFDAQKTVAIERAQAFCEAVRRHDFGLPVEITASIGVATFPYDARSASELLETADAAMYHSKRTGRNRVSFSVNGTAFSTYR